jgi:MFS family permease
VDCARLSARVHSLIVSAGRLGDVVGRRRLLIGGLALFTAASVLSGVAPTLGVLIAARAAQGLGAAVMMALSVALAAEIARDGKTGSAMGLLGTTSAIGTVLGPSLGGVLTAGVGWRAIFLINAPFGLVALFLAYRYLPADSREPRTGRVGFDFGGTLLLGLTLAAYSLAMTIGRGSFGPINGGLLVGAAVGVYLFARAERRAESPLIRLTIFGDAGLRASLATSLLVSTVLMATLVVGPFYLARGLGLNTILVGLVMSAGPLVAALTGVPAGRIVDRFGAGRVTMAGLIGIAAGCVILSVMPVTAGISGYVVPIAAMTASYALFQTANNTGLMRGVHPGQRGVISGMLNLSRNLGLITGASVMGAVFALASGTSGTAVADSTSIATGMRTTFGVALSLIVTAMSLA